MESLLRWGIANSTPGDQPPRPRTDLDPGIIDAILGRSDAELMKESLTVAVDEKRDEDERIQALDNFEMLIEQIDNANNLEKLKMWEPLHSLLVSPTSSEGIQMQTLWILGTAVQNNPAAQNSYLALSPLRALLSFLSPTVRSSKTRSKAVYALSGLLKHNAVAVAQMHDVDGWNVFRDALRDSDITVRRKVAFLLNALLAPIPALHQPQSQPAASQILTAPLPVNVQAPLQVPTSTTALAAASASASAPAPAPAPVPSLPFSAPASSEPTAGAEVSPPQTVHPNSHASMVVNPSSFSTSPATVRALEEHGLLRTLVAALAAPVPHGPDGAAEGDADLEEKVLRALHTYSVVCGRALQGEERRSLGEWLRERTRGRGGDAGAAERWGLTEVEVRELKEATSS